MKTKVLICLLIMGNLNILVSQQVYYNDLYCLSTLTLFDNGRDWYDCEVNELYYGHYWQQNDTLFVETFCTPEYREDHSCFNPRVDIYLQHDDTLLHVAYQERHYNSLSLSDSTYYFLNPFVYVKRP